MPEWYPWLTTKISVAGSPGFGGHSAGSAVPRGCAGQHDDGKGDGREAVSGEAEQPAHPLRRALQPLQRLQNLGAAAFGFLALFLLAFDHLLGGVGDEFRIVQLLVDALDIGIGLRQFLLQPRALGR